MRIFVFLIFFVVFCFGSWRGSVSKFNVNSLYNFKNYKPSSILHNVTYYKPLYQLYNPENLLQRYKSQFLNYDVISFSSKSSVVINFINQITFLFNSIKFIISTNYTYNYNFILEINNIKIYKLVNNTSKLQYYNFCDIEILNFINIIKSKTYCISTIINLNNNCKIVNYYNNCDFEYFFNNSDRIIKFLNNNILISLPKKIREFKPFTLVYGFYIQDIYYIQIHFNYNTNNQLYKTEYIEFFYN